MQVVTRSYDSQIIYMDGMALLYRAIVHPFGSDTTYW